jgi:hypothetical protein
MPWQPSHTRSTGSSAHSMTSAQGPDAPKEADSAFPRSQPAPGTRGHLTSAEPRQPHAPMSSLPAASQVPQWATAAPVAAPAPAPAPAPPHSAPNPNAEVDEAGPDNDAPWALTTATRAGGEPYVDENERARPYKNWRMSHDGYIAEWFLRPDPSGLREARLTEALRASNGRSQPSSRQVFLEVSH